ncbi:MAG: transposase family protein, partial [Peptococcaceae bacterium]|nr:transposase family protein [Peptococcaceae bacterium]
MPKFKENLKLLFPELEDLPHHDTLNRLLIEIEVDGIEIALVEEIRRLIRNRKFARYLLTKSYLVTIDGTRKFTRFLRRFKKVHASALPNLELIAMFRGPNSTSVERNA